jgi:2-dehydropantoate 2-reductase
MEKRMKIVIVGAGALGGLVGAQLTAAGEDVTLIEINEARTQLLNETGLFVAEGNKGETCVPVKVATSVAGLPVADLVFVSVKSYQTEPALRACLPVVGPETFVLSMQNGIGNTQTMAEIIEPGQVLSGITYHSIQHVGPNRIRYRPGIKPIQIAPYDGVVTPEINEVGEVFRRAGLNTEVADQIDDVIWQKLLHNAVVNPVSALTGLSCRELLDDTHLQSFMRDLCLEIIAVMKARGVPIVNEEDPYDPVVNSQKALGKNRPSMWQDLARSYRTEVDAINGAVVREAERLGLDAPHNRGLVNFIHSREKQSFLRKQEVAAALRSAAVAAAESGEGKAQPQKRSARALRPIRPAPGGGMPASRVPLESAPKLKELITGYYRDLQKSSDDPKQKVAWCSGTGPVEILRAMGFATYFPENHAALLGASRQSGQYIMRALQEGFSQFASSAMASDIGAMLEGDSPLVSVHGIEGPPQPDLLAYNTNYGNDLIRWFEYYGRHFDRPVLGLHPSTSLNTLGDLEVGAATLQILQMVDKLEDMTGRRLDYARLSEVVKLSNKCTKLWGEILDMCRQVPTPLTFFDTLIHLAPSIVMRGTPEAVEYYTLLRDEVHDRLANGVAAVPGERFRFYWEGPPIWPALRPLADLFLNHRVAVVGSTYCNIAALAGIDPKNPIESMARVYTGIFHNRSDAWKEDYLVSHFNDFGVDGVIYHEGRTAPYQSNVRYGLEVRLRRRTGLHALVIEGDTHDLRLFSMNQIMQKLRDFIEIQELATGAKG